jgi:hypothetical protein
MWEPDLIAMRAIWRETNGKGSHSGGLLLNPCNPTFSQERG